MSTRLETAKPAILLAAGGSRHQIRQLMDKERQITARRKVSDIAVVGGIREVYGGNSGNVAQKPESFELQRVQYRTAAEHRGERAPEQGCMFQAETS